MNKRIKMTTLCSGQKKILMVRNFLQEIRFHNLTPTKGTKTSQNKAINNTEKNPK